MNEFTVKDSGKREDYASGMRRDVEEGKIDFTLALDGPMFVRYADHLTKGAVKYGKRNWQLANSVEEMERFKRSALRHMLQWLNGDVDEDHAAAVMFNLNAAEYVKVRLRAGEKGLLETEPSEAAKARMKEGPPPRLSEQLLDATHEAYGPIPFDTPDGYPV